ncbi:50S ribosomal protein L25, partial [Patescibacteria group bacterium]|nr:50S ribosomal protein L25 [Patescibacteria group bacterium]
MELKAKARKETGKQVKSIRKDDKLPAVLYGHKVKNKNLTINYPDFDKIYQLAGGSTLIDLKIDDGK